MLNNRVNAFWEEYFHKGDGGLNWYTMKFIDGQTMTQVYAEFEKWHSDEFGETHVEPSLKTFGGQYGAFLSTDAGKYFEYKRTKNGRQVRLRSEYTDFVRSLEADEMV
jgi:hypothetical protein